MATGAISPVEATERAAEDKAVRFLLDGLGVESIRELKTLVDAAREVDAYDAGYLDGLAAYAWWKDGGCYVGTTGRTLAQAIEAHRDTWNYLPRIAIHEIEGRR